MKKGYSISPSFAIAPYNNFEVQILIIESRSKKVLKKINRFFPEVELDGSELAFVHKFYTDRKQVVIGFNVAHKGSALTVDTIAHEAIHVKNILFESIGQELKTDLGSDEVEAYLVGYLTHIIFDYFVKTANFNKIEFKYNEKHY